MSLDLSALDQHVPTGPRRWVAPLAPLEAFEEDPDNPRCEEEGEDFAMLVEDVRRHGILQPVVVVALPGGRLRLRFGQRRYRAARALHLPGLPYVVTEDERQFDDYAQVAENERRKPLQPLELAGFVSRKLAQGARKKEVAQRLGIDASAVTHLLALADRPPPFLLELYHSRRCRTPQYLYELRKLWETQPEFVAQRAAAVNVVDRAWLGMMAADVQRLAGGVTRMVPTALPAGVSAQVLSDRGMSSARQSDRIRRPLLTGHLDARGLRVLLDRLPSQSGLIWVLLDGAEQAAEVPIGALRLTGLSESGSEVPQMGAVAGSDYTEAGSA